MADFVGGSTTLSTADDSNLTDAGESHPDIQQSGDSEANLIVPHDEDDSQDELRSGKQAKLARARRSSLSQYEA